MCRLRFGFGHFTLAVVLIFTFFNLHSTVCTATTLTTSQSQQPVKNTTNQPIAQVKNPSTSVEDLITVIGIIIAAIGSISAAIISAWSSSVTEEKITKLKEELTRDTLREARLEEHVFNSLQWLSGGTQKRSIGIAVIDANWEKLPHLHKTWTSVLVAQAVYLLAEQERKETKQRQHEITNANSILRILEKAKNEGLLKDHIPELKRALDLNENDSQHGLELPSETLKPWKKLI